MIHKRVDDNFNCHYAITSEEYIDIYARGKNFEQVAKELGAVCVQRILPDWVLLHVKREDMDIERFYLDQEYVLLPNLYGLSSVSSMSISGITPVLKSKSLNLSGNGVIIGIIDTGIDYTHEAFTYEDNTSKILSIWDQTIEGTPPEGFLYGTEYLNDQINEAINSEDPFSIVPSKDNIGHGTYLAGLAAGRPNRLKNFQGAAPDADLVIVKLKQAKKSLIDFFGYRDDAIAYQTNDIYQGLYYIIDKTKELNKPLVILFSGISSDGPHNGTNELEKSLTAIGDTYGVVVVTSAGNEANKSHHYFGQLSDNQKQISVEFNVAENEKGVFINMWSPLPDKLTVEIISPSGNTTGKIDYGSFQWFLREFPVETSKIRVLYDLLEERTAEETVAIIIRDPQPGLWTIIVYGDLIVNGQFDMYLPIDGFIDKNTYFLNADPERTIAIPSTNMGTLTIGAYNEILGSIYPPSGRGFTRDNIVKPDIVAPGVRVIGTLPNNLYGVMSGTSVSAAITAGASALLLEWGIVKGNDIRMNTTSVKTLLVRGAKRREEIQYPSKEWGYGELDLISTFEQI